MIGLQEMLMQTSGTRIFLFPAWDRRRDVEFKLHAPAQTVVHACLEGGRIIRLDVQPPERATDVVLCLDD
jgi:hypothetical protein